MTSFADEAIKGALSSKTIRDEDRELLAKQLGEAWLDRVLVAGSNLLTESEQTELEAALIADPNLDALAWIVERHPEMESMIAEELEGVVADWVCRIE